MQKKLYTCLFNIFLSCFLISSAFAMEGPDREIDEEQLSSDDEKEMIPFPEERVKQEGEEQIPQEQAAQDLDENQNQVHDEEQVRLEREVQARLEQEQEEWARVQEEVRLAREREEQENEEVQFMGNQIRLYSLRERKRRIEKERQDRARLEKEREKNINQLIFLLGTGITFRDKILSCNGLIPATILSALYFVLDGKGKINKLPVGSELFKKRLGSGIQQALCANILNSVNPCEDIALKSNGWKFMSAFLALDLASRYSWDLAKGIIFKQTENTEDKENNAEQEQAEKTTMNKITSYAYKAPRYAGKALGWFAKAFVAYIIT